LRPTLDAVARLQTRLERIGNIRADGRPILGLDSRDLLEIALETDARCHFIPAHIWTPWFAMLGSMSGFDSGGGVLRRPDARTSLRWRPGFPPTRR
jgi:DNA helicase-2/ATP-dependent DNA helicase PcrA